MSRSAWLNLNRGLGVAALLLVVLAPLYLSHYWLSAIFTQALWYGIAAASLIFLSALRRHGLARPDGASTGSPGSCSGT